MISEKGGFDLAIPQTQLRIEAKSEVHVVADLFGQCLGQGKGDSRSSEFVVLIVGLLFRISARPMFALSRTVGGWRWQCT